MGIRPIRGILMEMRLMRGILMERKLNAGDIDGELTDEEENDKGVVDGEDLTMTWMSNWTICVDRRITRRSRRATGIH
jgi:hypothetical protein